MVVVYGGNKLREMEITVFYNPGIVPNERLLTCRFVNIEYLARILRLLSSEGIVTEHKSDVGTAVYNLTDAGKLLQVKRVVTCRKSTLSTDLLCKHFYSPSFDCFEFSHTIHRLVASISFGDIWYWWLWDPFFRICR